LRKRRKEISRRSLLLFGVMSRQRWNINDRTFHGVLSRNALPLFGISELCKHLPEIVKTAGHSGHIQLNLWLAKERGPLAF